MTCNSLANRSVRLRSFLTVQLLLGALILAGSVGAQSIPERPIAPPIPASGDDAIPEIAVPDDGSAVVRIVASTRFTLLTPYLTEWNAERSEVSSGTLLVLEVEKKWLRPRQTRQPVLYVGELPAEVLHSGYESGKIVVVVPDAKPGAARNLEKTLLFFGTPMLPERVTAERGRGELRAAKEKGIQPLPSERRATPSKPLTLSDRTALLAEVGSRIIEHSPAERALGEGLRGGR